MRVPKKAVLYDIVREFAKVEPTYSDDYGDEYCHYCEFDGRRHSDNCAWRVAVEALGGEVEDPKPYAPRELTETEKLVFATWEPLLVRNLRLSVAYGNVKATDE